MEHHCGSYLQWNFVSVEGKNQAFCSLFSARLQFCLDCIQTIQSSSEDCRHCCNRIVSKKEALHFKIAPSYQITVNNYPSSCNNTEDGRLVVPVGLCYQFAECSHAQVQARVTYTCRQLLGSILYAYSDGWVTVGHVNEKARWVYTFLCNGTLL